MKTLFIYKTIMQTKNFLLNLKLLIFFSYILLKFEQTWTFAFFSDNYKSAYVFFKPSFSSFQHSFDYFVYFYHHHSLVAVVVASYFVGVVGFLLGLAFQASWRQ